MTLDAEWTAAIDAYSDWLVAEDKSRRTIALRRNMIERLARSTTASLTKIKATDLVQFMSRKDWSTHTKRSARTSLVDFFAWAVPDYVPVDPSTHLPTLPAPTTKHAAATGKSIDEALAKADERTRLMVTLATVLQLKAAEIATIHPDSLALNDDGVWMLRARGAKGAIRLVEVPSPLAEEIRSNGHGWVFPGRIDGHMSPAYVSKRVSRVMPEGQSTESLRKASAVRREGDRAATQWLEVSGYYAPKDLVLGVVDDARMDIIQQHLKRIGDSLNADPAAAVSHCKNLLESLFKIVLDDRGVEYEDTSDTVTALYKKVAIALDMDAAGLPGSKRGTEATKRALGGMASAVQAVAEMRNAVGDGHGSGVVTEVETRHARLAFNATVAVAEFIVETVRRPRS